MRFLIALGFVLLPQAHAFTGTPRVAHCHMKADNQIKTADIFAGDLDNAPDSTEGYAVLVTGERLWEAALVSVLLNRTAPGTYTAYFNDNALCSFRP